MRYPFFFFFPVGGGDPNRHPLLVRHTSQNTPISRYISYAALWWIECGYSSRAFQLLGEDREALIGEASFRFLSFCRLSLLLLMI